MGIKVTFVIAPRHSKGTMDEKSEPCVEYATPPEYVGWEATLKYQVTQDLPKDRRFILVHRVRMRHYLYGTATSQCLIYDQIFWDIFGVGLDGQSPEGTEDAHIAMFPWVKFRECAGASATDGHGPENAATNDRFCRVASQVFGRLQLLEDEESSKIPDQAIFELSVPVTDNRAPSETGRRKTAGKRVAAEAREKQIEAAIKETMDNTGRSVGTAAEYYYPANVSHCGENLVVVPVPQNSPKDIPAVHAPIEPPLPVWPWSLYNPTGPVFDPETGVPDPRVEPIPIAYSMPLGRDRTALGVAAAFDPSVAARMGRVAEPPGAWMRRHLEHEGIVVPGHHSNEA